MRHFYTSETDSGYEIEAIKATTRLVFLVKALLM